MYTWDDHERRMLSRLGLTFTRKQSVLDVGCGGGDEEKRGGTMSYVIAQQAGKVIGVDIQPNPAWKGLQSKSSNLGICVADARKLPFRDNTFDLVFAKDLLHHIDNHTLAVAEMKRVAKARGSLIIVESNRYNPIKYVLLTMMRGHQHFTSQYFRQLILKHFTDAEFKSFEDHYYPAKTELGKRLLFAIDAAVEKMPFLSGLLGYNMAMARK